jgi:hypothetical protein
VWKSNETPKKFKKMKKSQNSIKIAKNDRVDAVNSRRPK